MQLLQDTPDPVTGERLFTADALWELTRSFRFWFSPRFFGLEHLDPARPALLVMNHTIYGMLDLPLIFAEVFKQKGMMVRGLSDRLQFMIPGLKQFEVKLGALEGSPENCAALMRARQLVLVCPGGGREVCKRKGEAYKLIWKQRTGFVRMAIAHGYPLIPLASVGGDDAFSILVDANDILASPIGTLLKVSGINEKLLRNGESIIPFVRGIGPTALPRPEPEYFSFGEPIETSQYAGREGDQTLLWELRQQVATALERQIGELMRIRAQDAGQPMWRQVLRRS